MEKLLTAEEKQILNVISNYLRANGLKEGTIEIDMDYGSFSPDSIENYDFFSNSYNVEIPQEFIAIAKRILEVLDENGLPKSPDVDEINYERLSVGLDAIQKELTIEHYYSYYAPSDSEGISWSEEEYEDESENPIYEMFQIIESDPEINPKDGLLHLRYNGSGDSGYIEDYFEEGGSIPGTIEDWCYRQLENNFGGWEINEGSYGQFIFDVDNNSVELVHTNNVEESETNTIYEEKF